jgi:hypothetical protein
MKLSIPENIEFAEPKSLYLAVYAHPDGYSLKASASEGEEFSCKLPAGRDAFEDFKNLFFDNEFLARPFGKVDVICFSSRFTLIPSALFDEKYMANYTNFLFRPEKEIFLHNAVPQAKMEIVFSASDEVCNFFNRSMAKARFIHHSSPLIERFLAESKNLSNRLMAVNFHEKGIDILCFNKGVLLLCNHFPCRKVQDTLYYILFAWKQLKFDQLSDTLHIIGNLDSRPKMAEHLEVYFQNITQEEGK